MTSPAWFTVPAAAAVRAILGNLAGCLTIPGSAGGEPATSCDTALRPRHASPWRAARHRVREAIPADAIVIVLAILALALLPGCSARGMVLTARASRLGPVAVPSPATAAQVIAAYIAYFPALAAAEPQPQARAVGTLAPYAAQPYLGHVLAQMAWYQAHDEVAWGYFVPHVTSVQINGSQAVVRDCQDASNAWLVSTSTGEVIPGTVGSARTFLVATLVRGGGERWRLTFLAHVGGPCSPVPSPS